MPPPQIMKYAPPPKLALKFRTIMRFFPNCALLYVFSKDFKIKKQWKFNYKFKKSSKAAKKIQRKFTYKFLKSSKLAEKIQWKLPYKLWKKLKRGRHNTKNTYV